MIRVPYGTAKEFSCELEAARVIEVAPSPEPNPKLAAELRQALACPLDYPPLSRSVIPDDHVVLALDRETPNAKELLAGVWEVLEKAGVKPHQVIVLEPAPAAGQTQVPAADFLPHPEMVSVVHSPASEEDCGYLATTLAGDRVYLAKELLEAEVVISIGQIAFDAVIGYRGTNSVFYPGLASPGAKAKAAGQGHRELGPENDRPLRQLIDEVAWLLGSQFSVQVIPSVHGGSAHVLAGHSDSVLRRGKELVNQHWLIELDYRADMVVVGVEADAAGHGWPQIGSALATARNLVAKGGRIVVLSELDVPPGEGLKMLMKYDDPTEGLRPLRKAAPPDLIPATELAEAVDWADVYLLSRLGSDLVEDLFMVPVESEAEVNRLLAREAQILFLSSAQHTFGRIRDH
jgi:nickel-dependent lactate racemase